MADDLYDRVADLIDEAIDESLNCKGREVSVSLPPDVPGVEDLIRNLWEHDLDYNRGLSHAIVVGYGPRNGVKWVLRLNEFPEPENL